MKSINQIFKNNKDLMDEVEVQDLIVYCKELEDENINSKFDKSYSFEDKLAEVVRDINSSCIAELKNDENSIRFGESERVDFKTCVENLKKFITDFSIDNKFRL